jgi:branched-chain amino acid transport system permease protein
MADMIATIYLIVGAGAFLMAFLKDKPSTKKIYKMIAAIFLLSLPFAMTSWLAALNAALLYSILAIGLNILLGNAGQISLGHAAFYALGAYVAATLTVKLGFPIFLSIFIAGIAVSIIGFILGTPVLRLKGHFLAIATLGMHVVVEHLIKDKLKHMFEGATVRLEHRMGSLVEDLKYGLREILTQWDYQVQVLGEEKPFFYDFIQSVANTVSEITVYFATLVILILVILMARNILRTKVGRALSALRDSELAARALGVNIALFKNIAFALSAFFAGLAGGIFALSIGTVDEASFTIMISLMVLAMIIIGGVGSIQGAVLGAVFFQLLDMKIIKLILGNDPSAQVWSPFIMGAALVLVIIFAPKGIVYMLYQFKLKITQKRS